MSPYWLLAASVALGVSKNILSRAVGGISRPRRMLRVNLETALIALLVFGAALFSHGAEKAFPADGLFFLLAACYGVLTMLSQILYIRAVRNGPVSVCALLYACGFLLPTFFAIFVYREPIGINRGIGIFLLCVSVLVTETADKKSADKTEKKRGTWLPFALGATAASGGVGILQKVTRTDFPTWDSDGFLFCAFAAMAVLSLAILPFCREKEKADKSTVSVLLGELCLGGALVFANKLNLYLSGVLPGSIFFPVVNGGCIALTAILSGALFRERFSARKCAGLVGSLAALVLISL